MESKEKKRFRPLKIILVVLLVLLVVLPLLLAGLSFIGRISSDSVIPGRNTVYMYVPKTITAVNKILQHEPLPDILTDPALASVLPLVSGLRKSGITSNPLVRFAANGSASAAVLPDGHFVAAYDTGVMSLFLRTLPALAGRLTVRGLYYVQAGKLSRFELRDQNGLTVYIGFLKNLVIVSDSQILFEQMFTGSVPREDNTDISAKKFQSSSFDLGVKVSSSMLQALAGTDPLLLSLFEKLRFSEMLEIGISITNRKLNISLLSDLKSEVPELNRLLSGNSPIPAALDILPGTTQYATVLSLAPVEELIEAAPVIMGQEFKTTLKRIDDSARMVFSAGLDELLYSWTGSEIAVFGLEGRPKPVFAVQVRDERKRREVFDWAFSSFVLNEDSSVVLDGHRVSQISLPAFLNAFLKLWNISVPAPYYIVQNGFLLFSESPENLLTTTVAINKNALIQRNEIWKNLSGARMANSSFNVYYSLDHEMPSILKQNDLLRLIFSSYRQGYFRLNIKNGKAECTLAVLAAASGGVVSLPGYPVALSGKAGNEVQGVLFAKRGESRILLTLDSVKAVSIDPVTGVQYKYESNEPVWCIPADGLSPRTAEDPSFWIVSARGIVTLVNGNMEPVDGFPVSTGVRLSSKPAAAAGLVYLPDTGASIFTVSSTGDVAQLPIAFYDVLRSSPVFYTPGRRSFMAVYSKSFPGELWLADGSGSVFDGWPVPASGIAYGSPVLVPDGASALLAFITQAGELTVYNPDGTPLTGFPVQLSGVFYTQPVFADGGLWIISAGGVLYRVSLNRDIQEQQITDFTAEQGLLWPLILIMTGPPKYS
ncbi:hypothetical protein K7I13_05445 [Brucepastera parasyntrophica]|uniref:hypothetical protein n=1 Tax=Brucepastera parasyntrophica TaxID=2880008 RepID=UPI00210BB58C|nr:hypothetical protein [Brucepastera parasyntrophica]ULQ60716.1 hypothetical protein K7I13_05445 [Brucepastera parasyntrophica]